MAKINWIPQDEIDLEKLEQMLMPTQEEIAKAKRELEIITLLQELGVLE